MLLGFLMPGPLHGYELHQRVQAGLGRVWAIGMSNLYGALKRLEEAGQVTSDLASQESRPPRRVYAITPAGRERFLDWVRRPEPTIRDMRAAFLARLYFHRSLALPGVETLIAAQEAVCRERLAGLEEAVLRSDPQGFDHLVFDFRRRQVSAILEWLQSCRQAFTPSTQHQEET
jgi:PadR family transcriptional regulator AphA